MVVLVANPCPDKYRAKVGYKPAQTQLSAGNVKGTGERMSAFIVSREHIVYLVNAAMSRRLSRGGPMYWYWEENGESKHDQLGQGDYDKAVEVGNMLWAANVQSIEARYPDCIGHPENRPGTVGENCILESGDLRISWEQPDPVQVLKACHCFAYQSCEYDGWKESQAHAFIKALESRAISALPGYDDAQWEISDTKLAVTLN